MSLSLSGIDKVLALKIKAKCTKEAKNKHYKSIAEINKINKTHLFHHQHQVMEAKFSHPEVLD